MTRPGLAQKRFSMHRFRQIPEAAEPEHPMQTPNEVTIDIPLEEHEDAYHQRLSQPDSRPGSSHSGGHSRPQSSGHSRPQSGAQLSVQSRQSQDGRKSQETKQSQSQSQTGTSTAGDDEPHRGMDSISIFRRYHALDHDHDHDDEGQNSQNPESEKAHLVPDCDAGSTGRRRGRHRRSGNSLHGPGHDPSNPMEVENSLGRMYRAVRNSSSLVRYFVYIVPGATLLAVPIVLGGTVARNATIGHVAMYWFFAWLEVVWFALWVSRILARALPYVFQFCCGIVSPGTRKYALMLRALEMPNSLVGWVVISLVTFFPMMAYNPRQKMQGDTDPKAWEKSVKNILFGLLACSLIFLTEKTLVLLVSINYHRKQFDGRIRDAKRNVHLLSVLYDASRAMFPMYCNEFAQEDAAISDSMLAAAAASGDSLFRGRTGILRSAGRNASRLGDRLTEMVGSVAQELTGKHVFNPTAAHSIVTQALERTRSSEALARRIWMSYVIEGREALYLEDIAEVLGGGREGEADDSFHVLDRDGNGDISLDEMVLTVTDLGRQRRSLNHSLHDVDQAIQALDQLLLAVAGIVGVLVFVSFVTTGFGTVIAAGATSLFSLSFIFSTTAQEVLGSCVFIFVKHPFDVGDRVDVDGRAYLVERISLLFTIFRCVADHRSTQVPNAILNTLWIDNLTRAAAMHERLAISVSFGTTLAHIQSLREEMEFFVRDKDNFRDFQPDLDVEVVGLGENTDRLQLHVDLRHKSNWANETVRCARRSKFMCALVMAMRKLQIRSPGDVPLPGSAETTPAPSINTEHTSTATEDRNTQAQGQSTAHLMVPDQVNATSTANESSSSAQAQAQAQSVSSSSTSTPGRSSLRRRNQSPNQPGDPRPPASTTEESTVADTDEPYETPATSPQRRVSLRYQSSTSTTGSAHPRSRQALLVRGLSTGHRNRRMSTAVPPPLYHGYASGPVYQPYPGAVNSGSDTASGSETVNGSAGRAGSAGSGAGSGSGSGSDSGRQYQAYDAGAPPAYNQDSAGQNQQMSPTGSMRTQRQSGQDQTGQGQGQERDPVSPPSPESRSNKSRAGSDEQGIGKPRGPRD